MFDCRVFVHAGIDALTHPHFWSLLPSTILDWVIIIVSVSPSVDATEHAKTSRECYLEYFARRPHRTDLLSVGAHEHYSGCTSLHLRKCIATRATHHPPAWHTSHIYISIVKGIGPCGTKFQALVQAHHMYIRHACTNTLDDLTRPSGAPGHGIQPVFALSWYKLQYPAQKSNFKIILLSFSLVILGQNR